MKIFILTPNKDELFTPDLLNKLDTAGEVIFYTRPKRLSQIKDLHEGNEEKILAVDPDFFNWSFPKEIFDKIPRLKAVCLLTTSYEWIDIEYARKKKTPVTNITGVSTEAVAEWAAMMALAVSRKIPLIAKNQWAQDNKSQQGAELKEKSAGIIGLGRIGKRIGEICLGLGMAVLYWSRKSKDRRFRYVSIDYLLSKADFIFPALESNEETRKILTDERLKKMKSSTVFVNIVPIEHHLYNHMLLLTMARQNKIYGYAFEEEGGGKFYQYEGNVWAGPALAWLTKEAVQRRAREWVDNIINAAHGKFPSRVD